MHRLCRSRQLYIDAVSRQYEHVDGLVKYAIFQIVYRKFDSDTACFPCERSCVRSNDTTAENWCRNNCKLKKQVMLAHDKNQS